MTAFYNEVDPYAAQWLRNLIEAGHIAPGVVDERPIQHLDAFELLQYTQCHFFAGIGIWSHALRRAGWPDERPIWTGSCPCQPFSNAGQQKGFGDERHLWPYWFPLIEQCRPPVVLGEQVASRDGLGWLDLVQTDMEAAGYAIGAADLCAAGVGGAHIRQRLYFAGVAQPVRGGAEYRPGEGLGTQAAPDGQDRGLSRQRLRPGVEGTVVGLADDDAGSQGRRGMPERALELVAGAGSVAGGLVQPDDAGSQPRQQGSASARHGGSSQPAGSAGRLADGYEQGSSGRGVFGPGEGACESSGTARERFAGLRQDSTPYAPMLGRNPADWLYCRDGKWRPVEPGTFPLVDADPGRVGKLRAYGNALDAETATTFCQVVRSIVEGL